MARQHHSPDRNTDAREFRAAASLALGNGQIWGSSVFYLGPLSSQSTIPQASKFTPETSHH